MKFTKIHFLFFAILFSVSVKAQTTSSQLYSLFVVSIAKYSSWPSVEGDFNITVFGKSKVYDELVKQNGKNVNGHAVKINRAENVNDIGNPQIIYLADSKSSSLEELLKLTEGKSVMIICEREGLHKKGAGFSFIVMANGTLRCDMNMKELEKRQIRISKNVTTLTNSTI